MIAVFFSFKIIKALSSKKTGNQTLNPYKLHPQEIKNKLKKRKMTQKEGVEKLEKSVGLQLVIEGKKTTLTPRENFSQGVRFQGFYFIDRSEIRKHNKKNMLRYWARNFWKIKAPTKVAVWQRGKQKIIQKM